MTDLLPYRQGLVLFFEKSPGVIRISSSALPLMGATPVRTERTHDTAADPQDAFIPSSAAPPPVLETIEQSRLPEGAEHTLALISSGNRFRGFRNGVVFHNKEKLLPDQPDGYYQEWTIREKGQTGRKKARLVSGSNGEIFFTANHYKSFRQVIRSA